MAADHASRRRVAADEANDRAPDSVPRKMLTLEQVLQIVPVSQATLERMERDGLFPRSTYISANRRCWFADEVRAWQDEIDGRQRAEVSTDNGEADRRRRIRAPRKPGQGKPDSGASHG